MVRTWYASTPVRPEQFEITDEGITHKPNGLHRPIQGSRCQATCAWTRLGNKLLSGEDYRPEDVKAVSMHKGAASPDFSHHLCTIEEIRARICAV
jgi:hypothetical protein